jgi:AGCS family alanine or glycine:cation symporter
VNAFVVKVTEINNVVNTWIWTDFGLYLLLVAGLIMTLVTGVF